MKTASKRVLLLSCLAAMVLASRLAETQPMPAPVAAEAQPTPAPVAAETQASSAQTAFHFELSMGDLPKNGKWKSQPLLIDLNQDKHLDIAVHRRLDRGAHVWLGDGKGTWKESSNGLQMPQTSCGGGIAAGNINRDGHLDLAVADHCQGVFVFLGDGLGGWKKATEALNPLAALEEAKKGDVNVFMGAEDLGLGDVNEDGLLDMVVTGSDRGGFTVYLGDGSGQTWTESKNNNSDGLPSAGDPEAEDGHQGGWAQDLLLEDVNGDGHLDVVASYYAGPRVWLGGGKAQWRPASEGLPHPLLGGIYQRLTVADLDADGRLDLVVANEINGIQVFLQQANGSWRTTPDPFPALQGGARSVAAGDLNRDGYLDLVVGGTLAQEPTATRGLFVLLGDGQGNWKEAREVGLPASGLNEVYGIALADIDGDGRVDILVTTNDDKATVARRGAANEGGATQPNLAGIQVWLNRK
jgi:hypothetical protein